MCNYSFFSSQKVLSLELGVLTSDPTVPEQQEAFFFSGCEALALASGCFLPLLFEVFEQRIFIVDMIWCNCGMFFAAVARDATGKVKSFAQ